MTRKTVKPNPEELDDKAQERAEERALFARYKADPSPRNEHLLVEQFTPLVYKIVHHFSHKSDQFEDLVQVGKTALVLAIRRFELDREYRFSTYAWTTIRGEIQRYFRDRTWAVNVPRDLKEKSLRVFKAQEDLTASIGHAPTVAEVAQATGMSEEDIQEAMELGSAYHPQSFQDNVRDSDASFALSDDSTMVESEDMATTKRGIFWGSLFKHLDETESLVLRMYYFDRRTQKEIADHLATSQMNVSRITRKALGKLRKLMVPEDIDSLGML